MIMTIKEYTISREEFDSLDQFQKYEVYGRLALRNIVISDDIVVTEEFAPYDAYKDSVIDGKRIRYLIEIKIRNGSYPDYMLDSAKLSSMRAEKAKLLNSKEFDQVLLLYVNFTPSGSYIWDIEKNIAGKTPGSDYLRRTTAAPSSSVMKRIYYLQVTKATKYPYVIDIENLTSNLN